MKITKRKNNSNNEKTKSTPWDMNTKSNSKTLTHAR